MLCHTLRAVIQLQHQHIHQGFVVPADVTTWVSIKDLFPHLLLFSEGLHQLTTLLLPLAGPQLGSFVRATVSTQFQSYCKVLQGGIAPHLQGGTVPERIGVWCCLQRVVSILVYVQPRAWTCCWRARRCCWSRSFPSCCDHWRPWRVTRWTSTTSMGCWMRRQRRWGWWKQTRGDTLWCYIKRMCVITLVVILIMCRHGAVLGP